jgi:uncharacterized membrane protein (UPF0136 family)
MRSELVDTADVASSLLLVGPSWGIRVSIDFSIVVVVLVATSGLRGERPVLSVLVPPGRSESGVS